MTELSALVVCGAILFSAGMPTLSLRSLDDSHYARKGVEAGRSGRFFTVTWGGEPQFQHPPLQFWLLGRSFTFFGENDFAAKLPSLVMALGLLAATYRIGHLTTGSAAALIGVACLLVTPLFVRNARGAMLEIPLAFWITTAMWLYLEGLRRPWLHLLVGLPLAAAILTKSVLGLLPILVLGVVSVWPVRKSPVQAWRIWLGLSAALVLGASWTLHQGVTHGVEAVRAHYLGEVASRTMQNQSLLGMLLDYPLVLLEFYQPLVIPGLVGIFLLLRRSIRQREEATSVLVAWVLVPLFLYGLSGARTSRYLFPIIPPLALGTGYWLHDVTPGFSRLLTRGLVPVASLLVALIFWTAPSLLTRDANRTIKERASVLRQHMAEGDSLPYLGDGYWRHANPLLYCAERRLEKSAQSAEEAVRLALDHRSRMLLCDRRRLLEIDAQNVAYETVLEGPGWVVLRFCQPSLRTARATARGAATGAPCD